MVTTVLDTDCCYRFFYVPGLFRRSGVKVTLGFLYRKIRIGR